MRNQETIAEENARRAEEDARRAFENSQQLGLVAQISAQEQDFDARDQIDSVRAGQATSGLTGKSQTRVVSALEKLAGMDRQRIVMDGQARAGEAVAQGVAFQQQAADYKSGANVARADADMALVNASAGAGSARLQGLAGLFGGFTGAGEQLLDTTIRTRMVDDFNRIFKRKATV